MTRFKGIKILGKEYNEIFIKDKEKDYYIRTEDEVVELLNEQQATIEQLKSELNDCEKFRYQVFKRIGELNYYNTKEMVVDLLNRLSEENEQLEKGKMEALSLLGEEIDKNEQLKKQSKRYEDGLLVRFTRLEKENEQLRELIEQLGGEEMKRQAELITYE